MKLTLWGTFIALFVLAVVFLCDIGVHPASWGEAHLGEPYVDLNKKFPDLHFDAHITDTFYRLDEPRLTGHWVTYYGFKDDHVGMRALVYRIGTQNYFKEIIVAYEEVPDWRRQR